MPDPRTDSRPRGTRRFAWAILALLAIGATTPFVAHADIAPPYLLQWGSLGTADGQMNLPCSIATDSLGDVYVVDGDNNRIQEFTRDGVFIRKWGTAGTGNGQFGSPTGIVLDDSSNVYVGDSGNDRVEKFRYDGTYLMQWGTTGTGDGQFTVPAGLSIDRRNNNVFVVNYHGRNIQKFTRNGVFLARWGSEGSGDGQFNYPYGVGVDKFGFVYVADKLNNRIQKFDNDGNFITKWGTLGSGPGQLNGPQNFAWDTDTTFYVTDKDNNRVQKFTNSGTYVLQFGTYGTGDGQFNQPEGICTDRSGANLYVGDWQHHRIEKFGAGDVGVPPPTPRGLELALGGANPTRGAIAVRWSLGAALGGTLRLYDVSGRLIERRAIDVGERGDATLGSHAALHAGLYLIELAAGNERRVVRAAVLR